VPVDGLRLRRVFILHGRPWLVSRLPGIGRDVLFGTLRPSGPPLEPSRFASRRGVSRRRQSLSPAWSFRKPRPHRAGVLQVAGRRSGRSSIRRDLQWLSAIQRSFCGAGCLLYLAIVRGSMLLQWRTVWLQAGFFNLAIVRGSILLQWRTAWWQARFVNLALYAAVSCCSGGLFCCRLASLTWLLYAAVSLCSGGLLGCRAGCKYSFGLSRETFALALHASPFLGTTLRKQLVSHVATFSSGVKRLGPRRLTPLRVTPPSFPGTNAASRNSPRASLGLTPLRVTPPRVSLGAGEAWPSS
jgi:hypothetical protein